MQFGNRGKAMLQYVYMMRWTPLVEQALHTATSLHAGQCRRGPGHCPFVVHPMCVALIASEYTDDETVFAAALLHDTVEDTPYTEAELRAQFGDRVGDLVMGVTMPNTPAGESSTKWGKLSRYADGLRTSPVECAIIAASDKIHNFHSSVDEYTNKPNEFLIDFQGDPKERIHAYRNVVDAITSRDIPAPLIDRLNEAWHKYTTFVESLPAVR